MNQNAKKRPRDNRHLSAQQLPTAKASPVACSVQQAIQRDPLQAMPGEEAAQRKHPVMHAIDLLINYDGEELFEPDSFNEAGRQLQTYHAEQMGALQQASGRAEESTRQLSELIEDVAEMLEFDLNDRTAGEMLEVLRDRLNPPTPLTVDNEHLPDDLDDGWRRLQQPQAGKPAVTPDEHAAIKNMHAVCTVLAKHFGDDPAVTFENAAGLVGAIVGDLEESESLRKYHEKHVEQLRGELQKRGGVTDPTPQEADKAEYEAIQLERMASLYATDEERQHALEEGLDSRLLLQRILVRLTQNQQPEGWAENAQILVESNKRYENALAAMRNVMSLV